MWQDVKEFKGNVHMTDEKVQKVFWVEKQNPYMVYFMACIDWYDLFSYQ